MQQLLITVLELKTNTNISGNMSDDKIEQYISIAQDLHIEAYLGSALYEKIRDGITAANLPAEYQLLLDNYIKRMVIHWSMVELLPIMAYTMSQKGVFKHSSENADTVSKDEIDYLIGKHRSIAENYSGRFIKYICAHAVLYPEYKEISTDKQNANRVTSPTGWVLRSKPYNKAYYDYI